MSLRYGSMKSHSRVRCGKCFFEPIGTLTRPESSPRTRTLIRALLLLSLAMGTGCSEKENKELNPTVTVQVATAAREPIERVISTEGLIFPVRQAALVPKVSAPVRQFFVQRGSHVHSGQLLAQLEDRDLAAAVMDNKGTYEQAQATYETTTKQSLPEEIRKAELDTRAAEEAMQVAQKVYTSQQNLFQQGATARKNVDDANLASVQARNQYDLAIKHFNSLKQFGSEQELKGADGQLVSARGKYQGAQAQLSFAEVRSPIDGVVTDRPLYSGETPAAGGPLITVMDISQIVVRAHIDQGQAVPLKVGAAARLSAPEISGTMPGKVTMVSPALDPGSTTVEVWVQAANPQERVRPGGSAQLAIVAEAVCDAVVIPAAGLLMAPDGSASVIVVDAQNKPVQKSVKVGIRNGDDAQITEGLQAGERVATAGAYDLSKEDPDVLAKTKVQIASPPTSGGSDDEESGKSKPEAAGGSKE